MTNDPNKPYLLWQNYGYEGWRPEHYASLEEALKAERFCSEWVITKVVKYVVQEC